MGNRQVSVKIKAAFDAAFNATFSTADERIKSMNSALKALRSTAADVEGLKRTRDEVARFTLQLSEQNGKLLQIQVTRQAATAALKVHTDAVSRSRQVLMDSQREYRVLTSEYQRMRQAMSTDATREQKAQLEALARELARVRDSTAAARQEFREATLGLRTHQTVARETGASVEQLSKAERELSSSIGMTHGQVNRANESIQRYENNLHKAGMETRDLQKSGERLNQTIERQTRTLKTAHEAQRLSDRAGQLRSEAMSRGLFTLGYGYLFTTPIREAVAFEKAMIRVKAMAGATSEEYKRLKDDARRLGAETVYSAKEVAGAQNELATAGYRTNEIIAIMPSMLALANSSMTGLARTAEITSEVLQGFRIDVSEMQRVGDSLTAAYSSSASSLESLGEMLKYVSAVAVDVNSSLEQTLAASSVLHNNGIKGSMAGTGLRSVFLRLAKPPKELEKLLDQMGVKTRDSANNMRNWIDVLHDVNAALEGAGSAKKAEAWKKIGGEDHAPAASNLAAAERDGSLRRMEKTFK
ncbi:MAG TPA: phage tail tape measure protein, partial [Oligoflexus sp.]|uniref:phage tail tape measure protein n=1 Tax=Oligoflexus sp. TaxID=1971216 RepID=UPI002D2C5B48